jgi:hypothetical protein
MQRRFFVLTLLACSFPVVAFTGGKPPGWVFTNLDVPGSMSTRCLAINHPAAIVGDFVDNNGLNHGFLSSGGVFTQVDVPGAMYDGIAGINDAGVVVGRYDYPAAGQAHGYVYDGIAFTTVDVPGATVTSAWDISSSGSVVGNYRDAAGNLHGFLLRGRARIS